jgi:putative transcriptional regulator
MIHRSEGLYGGNEIYPGVFWGGSYESLQESIRENSYQPIDLRLFVGYSGWAQGQLEKEVGEGAWLVTDATPDLLFETDPDNIWRRALELMGDKYAHLANLPINPQLN